MSGIEATRAGGARRGRAVRYGAMPLVVLAATQALEQGERLSLAQAFDGLKSEFGLSDFQLGLLPAAMVLVGVVGAFPFGFLADRLRRTALLAGGMGVWTLCMVGNALAPGYGALFAARLGVGAVESNGPAAVSLIADYYPVRERAKRIGLWQSGALVGAVLGLLGGGVAVSIGGWRWAFWIWLPAGALVTLAVLRLPEPRRGDQDADFHDDMSSALATVDAAEVVDRLELPDPPRVGDFEYERASPLQVYRELVKIRSMWFALVGLTVGQVLLVGLQAWAVEFFKRVHDLGAAEAGIYTTLFGLGAAVGVLGGGFAADRWLRRGVVNARIYVASFASIATTVFMLPAFLSDSLVVAGILMTFGGFLMTLPIAPTEAVFNDVVVAQLRGRAATVRSVVRSAGALGPLVIGGLSSILDLQTAVAAVVPVYAASGLIMLLAARSYPADLAFVGSETRRLRDAAERTPDG